MKKFTGLFAIVLTIAAAEAYAATASISMLSPFGRDPSATEIANDAALTGKKVYEFFVTTDSDILSVDQVQINVASPLYQNALGSDTAPPNPALLGFAPAIGADSYIDTPGAATATSGGFATPNSSWFDTTIEGAQTNFKFAQLTTSGALNSFSGRINLSAQGGTVVENFPFSFTFPVPEPATFALGSLGLLGLVAVRRRTA